MNDNNIRVLLVDDEEEFLESTAKALRKRGFLVTIVSNALKAIKVAEKNYFDVAVLDVKMPEIDGHQLFFKLRELVPDLQIIMLTGHGSIKRAFELGKNGLYTYLSKPVEIEELANNILKASKHQDQKELLQLFTNENIEELDCIRLLLVDDEVDFIESLKKSLTRRNMKVFTAINGNNAIELMKAQKIDVAIVDVKMPGIDGMELLDIIKQEHPLTEVILLTGHANVSLAVNGMKKGAYDYLIKPQATEDLIEKIKTAFLKKVDTEREKQKAELKEMIDSNPS